MPFVHASRVRFVDTDASGRIHYTAMLRHFEASESEFFRASGLLREDVQNSGVGWPRVQVGCTYGDSLDVEKLAFQQRLQGASQRTAIISPTRAAGNLASKISINPVPAR